MRLSPTLRVVVTAVLLFAAVAVVWWLVGFQIGKGLMDDLGAGGAWRSAYGFKEGGVARLLFLSLLAVLALAIAGPVEGWPRWALLTAVGLGAALVLGHRDGALVGTLLFVLATAAVDEAEGGARLVLALALGLLVAFAFGLDDAFTAGQAALAVLLRGVLFYWPLLAGPHLLERHALARIAR